ncbi:MAG TPA: hypothetical protein V6D18_13320 [Thermosynechococcaceae cyanobacterium]
MRQRIWVALAGAIALAATGCSSESTTTAPSPSPVPVAKKPATQNFNQPTVNQKLPPPPGAIPGLIQSTNGEERAKQVQAGIQATKTQRDPFKSVPPAATITATPTTTTTTTASAPGGSSSPTSTPSRASAPPRPSSPFPSNSGVRPGSVPLNSPRPANRPPSIAPAPPSIAALPPLPSADLANEIQVTGVVQVGGVPQAIIKAPNEPASRYVSTGQRLSNGQVLVKRIVVNNGGGEPVVILEENGIEVAKAVGDTGPRTAKPV